jgi:hypothetical protein
MDVLHACCAGLDVHQRDVVATVRRVDPVGEVSRTTKTFATMTCDPLDLSDWLSGQGDGAGSGAGTGTLPGFRIGAFSWGAGLRRKQSASR